MKNTSSLIVIITMLTTTIYLHAGNDQIINSTTSNTPNKKTTSQNSEKRLAYICAQCKRNQSQLNTKKNDQAPTQENNEKEDLRALCNKYIALYPKLPKILKINGPRILSKL